MAGSGADDKMAAAVGSAVAVVCLFICLEPLELLFSALLSRYLPVCTSLSERPLLGGRGVVTFRDATVGERSKT